jgi:hypothetical protein
MEEAYQAPDIWSSAVRLAVNFIAAKKLTPRVLRLRPNQGTHFPFYTPWNLSYMTSGTRQDSGRCLGVPDPQGTQ